MAKTGPGRPRDPEKRHHVLVVARGAFAEFGYTGASLGIIAERAGLTKAAVLHHFRSKLDLYFAVLDALIVDLGALVGGAATGTGPFPTRLDQLTDAVVEYLGADRCAAKLLLAELVGRGPYATGPGADGVAFAMRAARDFLQGGIDSGEVTPQAPEQLALSIVGVHLVYFAATDVTADLIGADPFAPALIRDRKQALKHTITAMCRALPPAP